MSAMPKVLRRFPRRTLPGFGLTLGFSVVYLTALVLFPFLALALKTAEISWEKLVYITTDAQVISAFSLSFGASALAAILNGALGLLIAWVLTRYDFPGRRLLDALVDLPFALPTAVAGIALTAIYSPGNGWLGRPILDASKAVATWFGAVNPDDYAIRTCYSQLGIFIALVFISLPFVVRTLQPVLQDLAAEVEEAAACLGASRWQTFWRVIWPSILPAMVTGVTLAFGRAVGEFGSIAFVSGNLPNKTQVVPMLIVARLDVNDYSGAAFLGAVMLAASFAILFGVNLLQNWNRRRMAGANG